MFKLQFYNQNVTTNKNVKKKVIYIVIGFNNLLTIGMNDKNNWV